MIKEAIIKIVNKEDLSYDEAYAVMNEVMSGESSQVQNAAFLAAMSTKSAKAETTDEISGCAAAMRAHATKVEYDKPTLEIVGTGGDGSKTFNISSIPRWSRQRAASRSRSTETERPPRTAVRRTSSRPPVSTLTRTPRSARSCSTR